MKVTLAPSLCGDLTYTTHSTYYTMISHTFVQGDLHRGPLDRGRAFDGEDKFSRATADVKSHYLCLQTLWGIRECVCVCVCGEGGIMLHKDLSCI